METQTAFGLGMLMVIGIALVIAVVIGMLKVSNLEAEMKDTQDSISRSLENIETNLDRMISDIHRRVDDTQSNIDSRFDKFENKITKKQILKD